MGNLFKSLLYVLISFVAVGLLGWTLVGGWSQRTYSVDIKVDDKVEKMSLQKAVKLKLQNYENEQQIRKEKMEAIKKEKVSTPYDHMSMEDMLKKSGIDVEDTSKKTEDTKNESKTDEQETKVDNENEGEDKKIE